MKNFVYKTLSLLLVLEIFFAPMQAFAGGEDTCEKGATTQTQECLDACKQTPSNGKCVVAGVSTCVGRGYCTFVGNSSTPGDSTTGTGGTESTGYMPSNTTPNYFDVVTNPLATILGSVSDLIAIATVHLLDVRLPEVFKASEGIPSYMEAPLQAMAVSYPSTGQALYTIIPVPIMGSKSTNTTSWFDLKVYSPAGIYIAWLMLLNIANLFFLVVLAVIGIILMLQIKVNHYALKVILPRFLVAIVLAQFSWIACDFAMDFTVVITWVFKGFMDTYHFGAGIGAGNAGVTLGSLLQNDGIMKGIVQGIQMCMVYGNVGSKITSALGGTKANLFGVVIARAIPLIVLNGGSIASAVRNGEQGFGDVVSSNLVPIVATMIGLCEGIGSSIMPMIWIAVLGLVSSVLMYIAMCLIRVIFLYVLVIISPVVCVLFVFPDAKKTVEMWTNSFLSLLVVYPLMILAYAVCYMIAYYLTLTQ